jgi:hypothetical protein
MHPVIFTLIAATSFWLVGCATHQKEADDLSFDAYKRALAQVATAPVPLPDVTPYDSHAAGRQTYLESYQDGYRTGLTGYYITPLFQDGPHHRERVAGYYAGLSAGWQAWAKDNLGPGQHFVGERPTKKE